MATRSDRTTGEYRGWRGSGPLGTRPVTRAERREYLTENRKKPGRGRYAGTPFLQWRRVRNALARIEHRFNTGRPMGPRPHPTKAGPGRL